MGGPGWATQAEFASTTSYNPANFSNSVRHSSARSAQPLSGATVFQDS
jgi:hypothetical protein